MGEVMGGFGGRMGAEVDLAREEVAWRWISRARKPSGGIRQGGSSRSERFPCKRQRRPRLMVSLRIMSLMKRCHSLSLTRDSSTI